MLKLNREDSAKRILSSFISSDKSNSPSDINDKISNHIINYLITNDKDNLLEIQRLAKIHPDNAELYFWNQDILNINNRDEMVDKLLGIDNSQQISSVEND